MLKLGKEKERKTQDFQRKFVWCVCVCVRKKRGGRRGQTETERIDEKYRER